MAVNAVMAGCKPEYFPVVIAAVQVSVDSGSDGVIQLYFTHIIIFMLIYYHPYIITYLYLHILT